MTEKISISMFAAAARYVHDRCVERTDHDEIAHGLLRAGALTVNPNTGEIVVTDPVAARKVDARLLQPIRERSHENDSFDQKLEKSAAVLGSLGIAEYTPTQDAAHGGRATVRLMDMAPAEISAAVKKLRDEGFQP